jgi:pilus assembly protein Flp/PilA
LSGKVKINFYIDYDLDPELFPNGSCMCVLQRLLRDRLGVTSLEYALIAALIAVAAIAAFTLVGTHLSTTFSTVGNKL